MIAFGAALAAAPSWAQSDPPQSKPSPEEQAAEWNKKGVDYKKENKTREAIEAFEKALEFAPSDPTITRNLGAAWNDEGVKRLEIDNNPESAIAAFEKAMKLYAVEKSIAKNKANAHERRGTVRLQKKQFDGAVEDYKTAIELDPLTGRYPTSLAYVAYLKEDYDSAERQLDAVVRAFEKETDAWVLLGETCYKKGDLRRAIDSLEKALKLEPNRSGLAERIEKIRGELKVEGDFLPQNSSHFQFRFPQNRSDLYTTADLVASMLEDAYWTVGRNFDHYPEGRTQVVFYEVKDFSAVTRADEWVGALYDGKIRVPIRDFEKHRDSLWKTLFHEYTHRVVHSLSQSRCPTWLNEGLAQISENANVPEAENRLRESKTLLLTAAELGAPFVGKLSSARARVAYDQSLSLSKYLVEQRGFASITRYLRSLAGDATTPPVAEPKAFEAEFRMTLEECMKRWRLSMNIGEEK